MRIFISTGEPSGDLHAANLVRELRKRRPDIEVVGFGGPKMKEAGAKLLYPLVDLAVMWFLRVLLNLHKFIGLANRAERYFRDEKPDAVVLIDYPGFHWHLAKRAKRQGIPVFYYVPPQIWAWGGWRVKKMQKYVDHVLCSLPFEPDWYRARGVEKAVHIGHPYFDELAERELDQAFLVEQATRGGPMIAVLPGSRTQEVTRNLPIMLRAAAEVARQMPEARFVVSCLHEKHRALAREIVQKTVFERLRIEVHAGKTAELIRISDLAWAVSGSVGLELMAEALPTVVLYKVRPIDLVIARPFIKAKYISIVNLLADAEVMPEYLTDRDVSKELADWARTWLGDPAECKKAWQALIAVRERVAVPGASARAAQWIVDASRGAEALKGPHRATIAPKVGAEWQEEAGR
jgi:lipid-A-disaccharide synthase